MLTVAGSDPSGGAGLEGDLATMHSLDVYGLSVAAATTVQNSIRVRDAHALEPEWIGAQLSALDDDFEIRAAKTGVLFSVQNVAVVADFFRARAGIPLVVDPIFEAGGGGKLAASNLGGALRELLLSRTDLLTPNLMEARLLTERRVDSPSSMADAARALIDCGARAVLVKGGHLPGSDSVDVLHDGTDIHELRGKRILPGGEVHGTGCALSCAAAARLALGDTVTDAVVFAREYVRRGIRGARAIGKGALAFDHAGAAQQE